MSTPRYILAIDQGTTGTTALVIGHDLEVRGRATVEFPQHFPQPGWVEHDAAEIWASTAKAVTQALKAARAKPAQLAGIGITNQRETVLAWDPATSEPYHRAIVWQCRRTADLGQQLAAEGHGPLIAGRTGLNLDPYFSGTKIRWLLTHVKGLAKAMDRGRVRFGTIDTFLVDRLTSGASYVTDVTNASRTQLMDLRTLDWDRDLLALFKVRREALPAIRDSAEVYGVTRGAGFLDDGIPIAGIAGDQQAALFGQGAWLPGEAKCTYGTGSFLLFNTGAEIVPSRHQLLTTVAWRIGKETAYALEGSAFIAGAAVQWLRDGLGIIKSAGEIEALAAQVPSSGGVVFVPALTGLGAPYWRPGARGLFAGITRGTTRPHLARAVLEGIAHQNCDIIEAMAKDTGRPIRQLRVDGGAAANGLLMQIQSDLLGRNIVRPANLETTAQGAAFLAGLATGFWPNRKAIVRKRTEATFSPQLGAKARAVARAAWAAAVAKA